MSKQNDMVQALFESMSSDSVTSVRDAGARLADAVLKIAPSDGDVVALLPFYSGVRATQVDPEQFQAAPTDPAEQEQVTDSVGQAEVVATDDQTARREAEADEILAAVAGERVSDPTEDDSTAFPGVPHYPTLAASTDGGDTARLYEQATEAEQEQARPEIEQGREREPEPERREVEQEQEQEQEQDQDQDQEPEPEPERPRSFTQEITARWRIEVLDHEHREVAATTVSPVVVQEVTPDAEGIMRVLATDEETWQDAAIRAGRTFIRKHTAGENPARIAWRRRGSTVRIILPDAGATSAARHATVPRMRRAETGDGRRDRNVAAPSRSADPAEVLSRAVDALPDPATLRGRTVSALYEADGGARQLAERVTSRVAHTVVMVRDEADLPYIALRPDTASVGEVFDLTSDLDLTPEALADEMVRFMHYEPDGGLGGTDWITSEDARDVKIAFRVETVLRHGPEFTYRFVTQVVR